MPEEIMCSKLLLVEGKDEENFFRALLNRLGLSDSVAIQSVGGKEQFKLSIPALKGRTGFSNVRVLGIVRDADNNKNAAFDSVQSILKKNHMPCPESEGQYAEDGRLRVGVYLMPGNSNNGMLEDLCLQTVADHPVMKCVNSFMECVLTTCRDEQRPTNLSKAKSQAFLSVMPHISNSVGIGAQKGYWDLTHQCLDELYRFLDQLNYATVPVGATTA